MRFLLRFFLVLLFVGTCSTHADEWTLVSKDGREIVVDYIFYDGAQITFRKVGDFRKFKVSPDQLSEDSWSKIEEDFAKKARIDVELKRRTRTKTDTNRSSSSGYYYSYSYKQKDTTKVSLFDLEVTSTSHFETPITVEYFIFKDDKVKYGQMNGEVSMKKPFTGSFEAKTKGSEEKYSSSYSGTYYSSGSAAKTADATIIVLDKDGNEIAQFANSAKLMEMTHSIKREHRSGYKSKDKKKKK